MQDYLLSRVAHIRLFTFFFQILTTDSCQRHVNLVLALLSFGVKQVYTFVYINYVEALYLGTDQHVVLDEYT